MTAVAQCPQHEEMPRGWITPQEQLNRLNSYNRAPIRNELLQNTPLLPELADLVASYVKPLIPMATHWHTSLTRLNALPPLIPSLPRNIIQILESKCPTKGNEKKEDGSPYTVADTHTLTLIPQELTTFVHFYLDCIRPYIEATYPPPQSNPLEVRENWAPFLEDQGLVRFGPTHWELTTKNLLAGSRNKGYSTQVTLIKKLSRTASAKYQIPTIKEIYVTYVLHYIATEERLYPKEDDGARTYTFVKEVGRGTLTIFRRFTVNTSPHLIAGSSTINGIKIVRGSSSPFCGVVAVRLP